LTDHIRDGINMLSPKWTTEVLSALAAGPRRYSELQCQLTLSSHEKVHSTALTTALGRLQEEGLIVHDADDRHAYRITSDGLDLFHDLDKFWRKRRGRIRGREGVKPA
jgi:DNA-binding HxlR family transcriptional regulator